MAKVRGHEPFIIEEIKGLWARGDDESCPSNHLLSAHNIQFYHSGISTRQAIKPYSESQFAEDLRQTIRVYNYTAQWGQSLLVMVTGGIIYHVISPTEIYKILEIPEADDFAFIAIAGRAYISPFKIYTNSSGETYALGIIGRPVYVYGSDRKPTSAEGLAGARPAAGNPPSNGGKQPMIGYNSVHDGKITKGVHIISITNDGGVGSPDFSPVINAPGNKMIQLDHIPLGPPGTIMRTIIMTKAIDPDKYTGRVEDYFNQFYKVIDLPDHLDPKVINFLVDIDDDGLEANGIYVPNATPGTASGGMLISNTANVGYNDPGFHLIGVVYETDSGYLSAPGPEFYAGNTFIDEKKSILVSGIPISPDSHVVKRHLVSTKIIPEYNGDQKGYQFFFIPKGTLEDNTNTQKEVSYYDSDLVVDASHLIDNFSQIPSGVNFCEYHSRLVVVGDANYPKKLDGTPDTTKSDNRSVVWVSAPGEPEAINQIDGLIIVPLDGYPLTNCQNFRNNLYLFKQMRTYSVVDNGDDPVTWGPVEALDQGIGASVHGIAEVLDSGGVNIDYLILGDWSGLMLFNGTYARPELSWKIENRWLAFDKNTFHNLQIVNDSIAKKLYIKDPTGPYLFLADYGNGLNPDDIRWAVWLYESKITSISLFKTDKLIIGTWQPV